MPVEPIPSRPLVGQPFSTSISTPKQNTPDEPAVTEERRKQPREDSFLAEPVHRLNEESQKLREMESESDRKIRLSKEFWEKYTPKPVAVPSVLSLTVSAASGRLGQSGLRVLKVQRQYSETVKPGHVVVQIPGPGGNTTKDSGITIIISKGPAPKKEKHNPIKQRETVKRNTVRDIQQQAKPKGKRRLALCREPGIDLDLAVALPEPGAFFPPAQEAAGELAHADGHGAPPDAAITALPE